MCAPERLKAVENAVVSSDVLNMVVEPPGRCWWFFTLSLGILAPQLAPSAVYDLHIP